MSKSLHSAAVLTAAGTLLAAGFVAATAASANAAALPTPPETGCPASHQLAAVSDLVALGYLQIGGFDINNDGYICVKPVSPKLQEIICAAQPGGVCTVPVIYYIRDNNLTPTH